jgi:hypothetical protein
MYILIDIMLLPLLQTNKLFLVFLDINECLVTAKCHQKCENTVGSYRCSCEEGFKLNLTNRQSCTRKFQNDILDLVFSK